MTFVDQVREVIKQFPTVFTIDAIAEKFGLTTSDEKRRVIKALQSLRRRDEVIRVEPGVYISAIREGVKPPELITTKIAKACFYKGVFTTAEVAALSGVGISTVRRTLTEFKHKGWIEPIGYRRLANERRWRVYQLKDRDGFYRQMVLEGRGAWATK